MKVYQRLDVDEETPVQFCAVYVTRWRPEWGEPTELFREVSDEQQALFDAAPDLLAACKNTYDAIASLPIDCLGEGRDGQCVWPIRDEVLHNIAKAIKKAEGE